MRILIVSDNKYLIRKVEIELENTAHVLTADDGGEFDAVITDRALDTPIKARRIVRLSQCESDGGTYTLPLKHGALAKLLTASEKEDAIVLSYADRSVVRNGKSIKLTKLEFSLLELLLLRKGEYASREEISQKVFGKESDSLINVYVHYLREKLENDGERIIISSRKHGYAISEGFVEKSSSAKAPDGKEAL